jgi:hypothetical protein
VTPDYCARCHHHASWHGRGPCTYGAAHDACDCAEFVGHEACRPIGAAAELRALLAETVEPLAHLQAKLAGPVAAATVFDLRCRIADAVCVPRPTDGQPRINPVTIGITPQRR